MHIPEPPKKKTLAERTREWLGMPERLLDITGHLANGGDLIDMCRAADVRYSDVFKWLNRDPGRKQAYESAVESRGAWMVRRLLLELEQVALVDIGQAYNEDGTLKELKDMPEAVRRVISTVETQEITKGRGSKKKKVGELVKVKFVDKLKGIELAGKHLRMFVDRVEHEGKVTLADLVEGSFEEPQGDDDGGS
jgi:hypothetical protein